MPTHQQRVEFPNYFLSKGYKSPHLVPLVDIKHSQVVVEGHTAFFQDSSNPAKQTQTLFKHYTS